MPETSESMQTASALPRGTSIDLLESDKVPDPPITHHSNTLTRTLFATTPPSPPPQEKSDVEPELPPRLREGWGSLQSLAVELAQLQGEHGLPITPEDYCREVLHPGLMQVCWGRSLGRVFSGGHSLVTPRWGRDQGVWGEKIKGAG